MRRNIAIRPSYDTRSLFNITPRFTKDMGNTRPKAKDDIFRLLYEVSANSQKCPKVMGGVSIHHLAKIYIACLNTIRNFPAVSRGSSSPIRVVEFTLREYDTIPYFSILALGSKHDEYYPIGDIWVILPTPSFFSEESSKNIEENTTNKWTGAIDPKTSTGEPTGVQLTSSLIWQTLVLIQDLYPLRKWYSEQIAVTNLIEFFEHIQQIKDFASSPDITYMQDIGMRYYNATATCASNNASNETVLDFYIAKRFIGAGSHLILQVSYADRRGKLLTTEINATQLFKLLFVAKRDLRSSLQKGWMGFSRFRMRRLISSLEAFFQVASCAGYVPFEIAQVHWTPSRRYNR